MASRKIAFFFRRILACQTPNISKLPLPQKVFQESFRQFSITAATFKVRKGGDKTKQATVNVVHALHSQNPLVKEAVKEMESIEKILDEELVRHFSTKVDLRVYEDIIVTLDNGEEHKMNRLGRATLKSPQMVMINFADNPTAIKAAKIALQKSSLAVTPQQEGIVLYIPVPRMTRERREELAHSAKTKILNDFKEALNDVYSKYDKRSTKESKSQDVAIATRNNLLLAKRAIEQRGAEKITVQQQEMMKEVA